MPVIAKTRQPKRPARFGITETAKGRTGREPAAMPQIQQRPKSTKRKT